MNKLILLPRHGPLPPAPGSDVALATSPNTAYDAMKQGGGQGGRKEEEAYMSPGGSPVSEEGVYEPYEVPSPPAPQQPTAVSSGGGTEGEGDMVYEHIQ